MEEKKKASLVQIALFFALGLGLLLLSNLGILNPVFSVSEYLQSSYRSDIRSRFGKIEEGFEVLMNISNLKKERDDYKKEVISLREEKEKLLLQLQENKVIQTQIQGNFTRDDRQILAARVIRYKLESPGEMVINKGLKDGVGIGDVLILKGFALGEVVSVEKYTSNVETLLSNNTQIPVINNNQVKGILVAKNGNELEIEKVLSDADVKVGDSFTTLGINSSYPNNLFVGEVIDITSSASLTTKTLKLKNEIDFKSLQEVFILLQAK